MRVYSYDMQDNTQSNYESDQTIDEQDLEKLTELEQELFGENLQDWLDLEVGKSQTEEVEELTDEENNEIKKSITNARA